MGWLSALAELFGAATEDLRAFEHELAGLRLESHKRPCETLPLLFKFWADIPRWRWQRRRRAWAAWQLAKRRCAQVLQEAKESRDAKETEAKKA